MPKAMYYREKHTMRPCEQKWLEYGDFLDSLAQRLYQSRCSVRVKLRSLQEEENIQQVCLLRQTNLRFVVFSALKCCVIGWDPSKKLPHSAMDEIRQLHSHDSKMYSISVLAQSFTVSEEAIRRILRSKFVPKVEKMRMKVQYASSSSKR